MRLSARGGDLLIGRRRGSLWQGTESVCVLESGILRCCGVSWSRPCLCLCLCPYLCRQARRGRGPGVACGTGRRLETCSSAVFCLRPSSASAPCARDAGHRLSDSDCPCLKGSGSGVSCRRPWSSDARPCGVCRRIPRLGPAVVGHGRRLASRDCAPGSDGRRPLVWPWWMWIVPVNGLRFQVVVDRRAVSRRSTRDAGDRDVGDLLVARVFTQRLRSMPSLPPFLLVAGGSLHNATFSP